VLAVQRASQPVHSERKAFQIMNMLSSFVPAGRRRVSVAVVILAVMGLWLLWASSALAETKPPLFVKVAFAQEVYSTRVQIEGNLNVEGLTTEWKAEYSTSCKGPWTEVNKETDPSPGDATPSVYIGESDPFFLHLGNIPHYLRHLTPNTSYCARFTAKNADGEATPEVVPFKTLPISRPEVDKKENSDFEDKGHPQYTCRVSSDTVAGCRVEIESNGAETTYSLEYAAAEPGGGRPAETSGSWKQFTSGATGAITVAEGAAKAEANVTGLTPETTYYVRVKMRNSAGETVQSTYTANGSLDEFNSFTTPTAKPVVGNPGFRNLTSTSAVVTDGVLAAGSETHWRFEYAQSVIGPWSVAPGGEGVISQAQAEAKTYYQQFSVTARLTGLSLARMYYVRLFAENAAGEGKVCYGQVEAQSSCEQVSVANRLSEGFPGSFETGGPPSVTTFAVHGLVGGQLQLDGGVNPKSLLTSSEQAIKIEGSPTGGTFTLTFNGRTTSPIAYNAPATPGDGSGSVTAALEKVGLVGLVVEGPSGGPYTVFFSGDDARLSEPQIECHSEFTPSGACTVTTIFKGGEFAETHYRFLYVSQASFAEHGWAGAEVTPEEPVGSGSQLKVVHGLLPVLQAGETYHYRLLATSSIPGVGLLEADEQTLNVPSFTIQPAASPCPNEALRTGLSAHLPDCRAYELVSAVDKRGSQEPFQYETAAGHGLHVGEEGAHIVLEAAPVRWGTGPGAGGSPYFFSREAGKGWTMIAGSPQPATGVNNLIPELYSADLSQIAFASEYVTSAVRQSERIEYKVGPAGGPYTTVASLPRKEAGGWVATNAAFSKPIFQTSDHSLLGEPTGTNSGSDLYEYTVQGGLRQMNVSSEGVTIGSCGAVIAQGRENGARGNKVGAFESKLGGHFAGEISSLNAVSADGSRVFFYASAPHECASGARPNAPGPGSNLYVRVNGSETFDIGPYTFVGANEQGTVVLLENGSGEFLGYDSETGKLEPESSGEKATESELATLGIPDQAEPAGGEVFHHPRYTYWSSTSSKEYKVSNGQGEEVGGEDGQVYRYDNVEHVVECVSCASPYDPDPKQAAFLGSSFGKDVASPFPQLSWVSANGEFAFFVTASALVPQDVDGEIPVGSPEEFTDINGTTSLSTDVYEWRAAGVDGCDAVQGCLSLITDGRGGYMNALLGVAEEGREAFIYTRSKLLAQDVDAAGDIYAVRVDGGFPPPPPRPTECEGDACSTPPGAPNDATPSSLVFNGPGNVVEGVKPPPVVVGRRSLTRAQRLALALRVCGKQRRKRKRVACERVAHARYGGASKAARAGRGRSVGSVRRGGK
jgi:hypothetical protein